MIHFACSQCKQVLESPDDRGGQVHTCSDCGQTMRVPAPAGPSPLALDEDDVEELHQVDAGKGTRQSGRDVNDEEFRPSRGRNPFGKLNDHDYLETERRDRKRFKQHGERAWLREALPPKAQKLGPMRTVHDGPFLMPLVGTIFFGILAVVSLACLPLGWPAGKTILLVPAVFLLPVGVFMGLASWRNLGLKVIAFEQGFVRIRRGRFLVVRWDDIELVWQSILDRYTNGIHQGTRYSYKVELHDGSQVAFNNSLRDIKRLGEILMHESSQAIYPRAMKQYDNGQTVDFGTLGVSQDGLHCGRSLLQWEDIDAVQIRRGLIEVSKRGKWFNWCNIPISSVPNLYVFLALVNEIVGVENA